MIPCCKGPVVRVSFRSYSVVAVQSSVATEALKVKAFSMLCTEPRCQSQP